MEVLKKRQRITKVDTIGSETFIKTNYELIHGMVEKYISTCSRSTHSKKTKDFWDMLQECLTEIAKHYSKWDPNRGSLEQFLGSLVKNKIRKESKCNFKHKGFEVSVDQPRKDGDDEFFIQLKSQNFDEVGVEKYENIFAYFRKQREFEFINVLKLTIEGENLQSISKKVGKSEKAVRTIKEKIKMAYERELTPFPEIHKCDGHDESFISRVTADHEFIYNLSDIDINTPTSQPEIYLSKNGDFIKILNFKFGSVVLLKYGNVEQTVVMFGNFKLFELTLQKGSQKISVLDEIPYFKALLSNCVGKGGTLYPTCFGEKEKAEPESCSTCGHKQLCDSTVEKLKDDNLKPTDILTDVTIKGTRAKISKCSDKELIKLVKKPTIIDNPRIEKPKANILKYFAISTFLKTLENSIGKSIRPCISVCKKTECFLKQRSDGLLQIFYVSRKYKIINLVNFEQKNDRFYLTRPTEIEFEYNQSHEISELISNTLKEVIFKSENTS